MRHSEGLLHAFSLTAVACLAVLSRPVPADDQPQWGQRHARNMVSPETGLPETVDPKTGSNVKWTAPLGANAYGSPTISGGKVLIGASESRKDGCAIGY